MVCTASQAAICQRSGPATIACKVSELIAMWQSLHALSRVMSQPDSPGRDDDKQMEKNSAVKFSPLRTHGEIGEILLWRKFPAIR